MKAKVKDIIDAYTQAVERCNKEILKVNEIHRDQPEESRAYQTKKIIDKWFIKGGQI